jgi:hypothetical protein
VRPGALSGVVIALGDIGDIIEIIHNGFYNLMLSANQEISGQSI